MGGIAQSGRFSEVASGDVGQLDLEGHLRRILSGHRLAPRFQQIIDLRMGTVFSHEGLIRGPSDTVLHSPHNLFNVAHRTGLLADLEGACIRTILKAWSELGQGRRLFVNLSPAALIQPKGIPDLLANLGCLGITPESIVIELTEHQPTFDYGILLEAANRLRSLGYAIALDDLGEGFSSLRLWSEIHPEFVKVDQHFVQGVSFDPLKYQFLRTLHDLARSTGARLIAEGVETDSDLAAIQDLGIDLGQGYYFGRPEPQPMHTLAAQLQRRLQSGPGGPAPATSVSFRVSAEKLLVRIEPVHPLDSNLEIQDRFQKQTELQSLPVVQDGIPVGLLNRHEFMDLMARPYSRELYGKRPCGSFMERSILVADHRITIHDLSDRVVNSDPRHIFHGFILTRAGRYLGMGSGHDLMREITQLQLSAARYSNPLTQLPGNVPIHEQIGDLLDAGEAFVVAYCDLDHFKPFNDVHGYRAGDEVIQWTGKLMVEHFPRPGDFVGHVGGDDFLLVLRDTDWEGRIMTFLEAFEDGRRKFFTHDDWTKGGYESENRQGQLQFHPLLSLSIGVVQAAPGMYSTQHEVASASTVAKKMAKRQEGCSLFVERRVSLAG
jgi:diguanylate cyclase (GGDEF)-like protein